MTEATERRTETRREADAEQQDEQTHQQELTKWRLRVDDFMDDAHIQRRVTAQQMGALESSVLELQGEVRESNDWSKKNHEALTTMVGFFEGMDNLRKLADTATKWGKPVLLVAGFIGAIVVWVKTGEWRMP